MIKKHILIFCLCGALAVLLTGCANGRVESTVSEAVSRAGEDLGDAMSRMEDQVDSMFEDASGLDSGFGEELDSSDGAYNSGLDGREEASGSAGDLESDLGDDGMLDDNGSSREESGTGSTRDR